MALASHVCAGLSPGVFTLVLTHYLWPGQTVEDGASPHVEDLDVAPGFSFWLATVTQVWDALSQVDA